MEYSADAYNAAAAGASAGSIIFSLALSVIMIVAMWKIFAKAGEPGWAAIVPIYNAYVEFKIAFGNGWLFLLCLIPFVGSIVALVCLFKLGKAFGKSTGFCIGLVLLSPIFLLILAFGNSQYQGA
ncbi:MAG: DUF5684 domain-containing protein [Lachnospiraceae bacterium]|nr:DUF5684 domain-containing protein [Lachnospiraceae bacterium]